MLASPTLQPVSWRDTEGLCLKSLKDTSSVFLQDQSCPIFEHCWWGLRANAGGPCRHPRSAKVPFPWTRRVDARGAGPQGDAGSHTSSTSWSPWPKLPASRSSRPSTGADLTPLPEANQQLHPAACWTPHLDPPTGLTLRHAHGQNQRTGPCREHTLFISNVFLLFCLPPHQGLQEPLEENLNSLSAVTLPSLEEFKQKLKSHL